MRRLLIQTLWTVLNCSEPHFQRNTEALRNRWILPVSVCFLLPACVFRNVESAMVLRLVTYEEPREWILCWTSSQETRKNFLGRSVLLQLNIAQRLDYSQAPYSTWLLDDLIYSEHLLKFLDFLANREPTVYAVRFMLQAVLAERVALAVWNGNLQLQALPSVRRTVRASSFKVSNWNFQIMFPVREDIEEKWHRMWVHRESSDKLRVPFV